MGTYLLAFLWFLLINLFSSSYAIPEADFYPFGETAGDVSLPRVLDNSSPVIPLTLTRFPYFGQFHNQLFVNSNGHITFFTASGTFVPAQFPLANDLQLISPFWADSDTSNPLSGLVWYRIATDSTSLQRAANNVQRAFPNQRTFRPIWLLVATWDHVGVYPRLAHVQNTFQCVLATDGESSFVLFLYADYGIEWLWSQDHQGIPGQVGFNAGDGVRYFSHPDSFKLSLMNIWNTTNVGVPGLWVFKVDGEEVVPAGCSNQENVLLTLTPRYGHLFGSTPVIVTGPCFSPSDKVTCEFGGKESGGKFISEDQYFCITPLLSKIGETNFVIIIERDGIKRMLQSNFLTVSPDRSHMVDLSASSLIFDTNSDVDIKWNPEDVIPSYIPENFTFSSDLNIIYYVQQYELKNGSYIPNWVRGKPISLGESVSIEVGAVKAKIPKLDVKCRAPLHDSTQSIEAGLCPIIIKVYVNIPIKRASGRSRGSLEMGAWSGIGFLETTSNLREVCDNWAKVERISGVSGNRLLQVVIPCPPTEFLARNDQDYEKEEMTSYFRKTSFSRKYMSLFHPGATVCYRQSTVNFEAVGQQCCYKENGNLTKGSPSGGSVDIMSPNVDYNRHLSDDLIPYLYCCRSLNGTTNCNQYYQWRPSGNEEGYILPIPACIYGDPHIVTLDGLKYTFNGKGEFTMIESNSFTLQGRMDTILDSDNNPTPGTVFTALVARQHSTNTTVQFNIQFNGLRVRLDGDTVNFDDLAHVITEYVALTDNGNNSVSVFFKEGVKMEIKVENGIISVMLITLPSSLKGKTRGLMGNFNGDTSDDLIPKFDTKSISSNSSLETIHNTFGITWILSSVEESYFSYNPGESFATFYDPTFLPIFQPTFENETLEQKAREVCGDDKSCLFDIAATKNVEIGMATMAGGNDFDKIVEMAVPVVCDPSCVNGACVKNNTCSCNEGYEGSTCEIMVVSECDVNMCQNNGTCIKHVLTYTCNCPNGFIGAFCQEKEPPFQIRLLNSSPRVSDNILFIDFETTMPASSANCFLSGQRNFVRQLQCITGRVQFSNIPAGSYVFRVQVQSLRGESVVIRRIVHVGETGDEDFCAIHLINEGVVVAGKSASILFQGTKAVNSYRCRLRGNSTNTGFIPCRSPTRYQELEVGEYQFQVVPVGCNKGKRLSTKFSII